MSESKFLFERAKKAATKAINAERSKDYQVAFEQFLKAADVLNQLMKVERSQRVRDSYYVKAKEYIKRAKEIKLLMTASQVSDLPDVTDDSFPSPPKPTSKPKPTPPTPPPPKEEKKLPPPPEEKKTPPLPPPPKDMTAKMMRGEDDEPKSPPPPKDKSQPKPPPTEKPKPAPKKDIQLPTKTTFELLFDEGKYRECVLECAKSVEAELRVRMGLFDEQLTLGMLIDRGMKKGFDILKEFKFVNILINRIEHEHYRPKPPEAQKAVDITNKILMS
ncbi:MAG: hypothetical protein FK733_07790 [Asgard group archaeon]|nr:hypothetical protein [Asgard group archaeon]